MKKLLLTSNEYQVDQSCTRIFQKTLFEYADFLETYSSFEITNVISSWYPYTQDISKPSLEIATLIAIQSMLFRRCKIIKKFCILVAENSSTFPLIPISWYNSSEIQTIRIMDCNEVVQQYCRVPLLNLISAQTELKELELNYFFTSNFTSFLRQKKQGIISSRNKTKSDNNLNNILDHDEKESLVEPFNYYLKKDHLQYYYSFRLNENNNPISKTNNDKSESEKKSYPLEINDKKYFEQFRFISQNEKSCFDEYDSLSCSLDVIRGDIHALQTNIEQFECSYFITIFRKNYNDDQKTEFVSETINPTNSKKTIDYHVSEYNQLLKERWEEVEMLLKRRNNLNLINIVLSSFFILFGILLLYLFWKNHISDTVHIVTSSVLASSGFLALLKVLGNKLKQNQDNVTSLIEVTKKISFPSDKVFKPTLLEIPEGLINAGWKLSNTKEHTPKGMRGSSRAKRSIVILFDFYLAFYPGGAQRLQ
ncbi:10771_t:CDS:2, partial [Gigaspora rosea]